MQKRNPYSDVLQFAIGEIIVTALTVLGFFVLSILEVFKFDITVVFGALLGFVIIVANYAMLTFSVNRELDKYMKLRGDREMSEEEAAQFAKENTAPIQAAIKKSFILRTASMLITLVAAFLLSKIFNPFAAAIPMFAFRPVLTVIELVAARMRPAPNPDNFVKYDFDDENKENEDKESN